MPGKSSCTRPIPQGSRFSCGQRSTPTIWRSAVPAAATQGIFFWQREKKNSRYRSEENTKKIRWRKPLLYASSKDKWRRMPVKNIARYEPPLLSGFKITRGRTDRRVLTPPGSRGKSMSTVHKGHLFTSRLILRASRATVYKKRRRWNLHGTNGRQAQTRRSIVFHFTRRQPYSGILWQLLSMTRSIQRPSTAFLRLDCLAQVISWLYHTPIEGKRHG